MDVSNSNTTCVPTGTEGTGFYTTHSFYSTKTCQLINDKVLDLVESYKQSHSGAFVICDYGCADGGVTNNMWLQTIDILKSKYGSKKEICIIQNDLPRNDFQGVFLRSHGQLGEGNYMKQKSDVCVLACGSSFYEQCLLSGSVDFAYTSITLHWLSKRPGKQSTIVPRAEDDLIRQQAGIDWENFLLARAMEMKPDGVGVFVVMTSQNPAHVEFLETSCQQLFTRNLITKKEMDAMELNYYYRSRSELEAPFHGPDSRVRAAGLELMGHQDLEIPCVLYDQYCSDLKQGVPDAAARFSAMFAANFKVWTNNHLMAALSDSRGPQEKEAIMTELYQYMQETLALKPHVYKNEHVCSVVIVRKST